MVITYYIDRDGDTWTRDPESGEYYTRHVYRALELDDVRASYGPLQVWEPENDRTVPEDEYRTETILRRIIREELDRRFGPEVTS